jgi:hypothetical protein
MLGNQINMLKPFESAAINSGLSVDAPSLQDINFASSDSKTRGHQAENTANFNTFNP